MSNKKNTGSFYTPKIIADFLVDYLSNKLKGENLTVLEPSSGDGIFVQSIYNHKNLSKKIKKVVAVEREEKEIKKVRAITKSKSLRTIHSDFLEFQKSNKQKFDLVIGNPPYFKKNLLTDKQKSLSIDIFKNSNLSYTSAKNIWAAFFVRAISFTNQDGVMGLVLPSDLQQVSFAKELKDLLKSEFERVEIFTFKELLFKDCKGQDTILLIAERKARRKGIYNCDIASTDELISGEFTFKEEIKLVNSNSNHQHLSADEFSFLGKVKAQLQSVNFYANAKPGVVTGANNYFIVDRDTVERFDLKELVKPIIQKGVFVNGSAAFSKADLNGLIKEGKPTYLIHIDDKNEELLSLLNKEYLLLDETTDLKKRYKIKERRVWYKVPNVSKHAEGLFFKRSHNYPKLLKNEAKVLATDAAYYVDMREKYQINHLIFSFYNSVTLAFAELTGRYYGGGVLEMVPSEFKSLPIPYTEITKENFRNYIMEFENKGAIETILKKYDKTILKSTLGFSSDEILKMQTIRTKLVAKRMRNL